MDDVFGYIHETAQKSGKIVHFIRRIAMLAKRDTC
jgi:hypothetical protein